MPKKITAIFKRFGFKKTAFKKEKVFNFALAGKWAFYFVMIGIIAGLGSVLFHYLCGLGMHYFLDMIAGYRPLAPAGEHHLFPPTNTPFNKWILLILPAVGGLFSGWLVYTFAPEAEGHGTDAAIDSYHNKGGFIRSRVPIIKTIASAVTLTTGGSGGREGPIAQIGAGFGSFLATKLKLSDRERRIMMAAGIGAGVGSIFRAPLAGALFAAEVLYKDPEFESEVIIPAGISSVVAYCIFCLVFGWGSLFDSPAFKFRNPLELGPYLILAVVLVITGAFYVKAFYGITSVFRKLKLPNHIKPAIGMGGVVGKIFHFLMPAIVVEPGSFVIVGMAGFFTAVSNTPISTIIFVSEMTNSYHLLLPSLLVCSVSYLMGQKWTIYEKQVKSRIDSPAHAGEFNVDILQAIKVKDLMMHLKKVTCVSESMPFSKFKKFFATTKQHYFPVVNEHNRLVGIFSSTDIREVLFTPEIEEIVLMKDIQTSDIIITILSEDLSSVLQKLTLKNIDSLPVVQENDHSILIGMLNRREIIAFYNEQIQNRKNQD